MEDKMIKFYYIDNDGGGGGNAPTPPKGYAPLTVPQRTDWNNFLDYAGKANVDFDKNPQSAATLMAQYKKTNPNFSLSPSDIQRIQYEQYQLRKGDKFGNLTPEQLKYLRQGLPDTYLNRPIPEANGQFNGATAKLYYPQKTIGNKSYGTDIEGYVNSVGGQPVTATPISAISTASKTAPIAGAIPVPDYTNPTSRLQYAQKWTQKYGPLMQGRGDTPLRVNDVPQFGTQTSKQMSTDSARKLGLDPALLYASAMEEGMSGNFPDLKGNYAYERSGQSDKFPINSSADFGLDQVRSEIKRFQSKGYLPADFQKHYTNAKSKGDQFTNNDVDLDSPESAMLLKAAYLKDNYDTVDKLSKDKNITLTQPAKDFFALVAYNAGEGNAKKMMEDYNKNGYLKNDVFLKSRPNKGEGLKDGSYKTVYENVIRRIQMRDALKKEGLFQ